MNRVMLLRDIVMDLRLGLLGMGMGLEIGLRVGVVRDHRDGCSSLELCLLRRLIRLVWEEPLLQWLCLPVTTDFPAVLNDPVNRVAPVLHS